MSSGRSPAKNDGDAKDSRVIQVQTSTTASSSRATNSPGSRPQWSTTGRKPRRGGTDDSPAMEGLSEGGSSDESDEDSDELEETDDATERRELSSSIIGETLDMSSKDLVYVLDVIQQPQRARACGFGDKDRRPLSPPPIIQLRILDKQGNTISPLAIDFHRFILTVDLWNAEGSQQRSIVMHPGARQDQYSLFTHASRVSTSSHPYDLQGAFGRQSIRPPPPVGWHGADWPMYGRSGPPQSPSHYAAPLPSQYPGPPTPSGSQGPWSPQLHDRSRPSPARGSYALSPQEPSWYDGPPRHHMSPSDPNVYPGFGSTSGSAHDSRGWTPEPSHHEYGEPHRPYPASSGPALEGAWREPPPPGRTHSGYEERGYQRSWSGDYRMRHGGPRFTHAPALSPISSQSSLPALGSLPSLTTTPLYAESYAERLNSSSHYSRVLVGSMGAVCQRLKGLDGQPGLFFFARDLGIRTEGTFSLRFTLVDITNLCVPNVVPGQSTNMLARVFSHPFTVYSAKRFPGVLPTTDLTQCFADQSVRLPTRQKRSDVNHKVRGGRRRAA